MTTAPRGNLVRHIASEIIPSDDPGAALRRWRADLDIFQTALAEQLDMSSPAVSDYGSGRRESPGIGVIRRTAEMLLDIDRACGGSRIQQHAHVLSASFESDIVQDLWEYPTSIPFNSLHDAIGTTPVAGGGQDRISGHTVINSVQAITRLSSEGLYRLYGQSTGWAFVSTGVTRGQSLLVAMRAVTPTPNAAILHGLSKDDLWEHIPTPATIDGFALTVTDRDLDEMLEDLWKLP